MHRGTLLPCVAASSAVAGQKRKQLYYLRLKKGLLFAFAGIWTPPDLVTPTCKDHPNCYEHRVAISRPSS